MIEADKNRRPLQSRQTRWANAFAQCLSRKGVRPNQVSLLSVVFACLTGASFLMTRAATATAMTACFYASAAVCIQLRLLCNLMDGMLAIEGHLKTREGEIYNELPDRVSDVVILVCAGYSISTPGGILLGWAAAVLALLTAYIRALGVSLNTPAYFNGPMAKPHRMFALTVGCVLAIVFNALDWEKAILALALASIVLGSMVTCARRTHLIIKEVRYQ